MGLVVQQTKIMVAAVRRKAATGTTKEKRKRPDSLIKLEEGLVVVQDPDGIIWIVRSDGAL
jgi:hypothetical protein